MVFCFYCLSCISFGVFHLSPHTPETEGSFSKGLPIHEYVLEYTGESFSSQSWERKEHVGIDRMIVFWFNEELDAIAELEFLHLEDTTSNIDNLINEEDIEDFLFDAYENLIKQDMCFYDEDNLVLREYAVVLREKDFVIKYWLKLESETTVIKFTLVYPPDQYALFNRISKETFPVLFDCSQRD